MDSILYLSCPNAEKPDVERAFAAAQLTVVWTDSVSGAVAELQEREMPVLLELSRGAVALQHARDIRSQVPAALLFAVVDPRRPDLTAEAVLGGIADVFARPLGGRRVAQAIERERSQERRAPSVPDDLYGHSPAMRDVMSAIARASATRTGVMIRGEDGAGRQVAARAIHAAQNGRAGEFIIINCAAHDAEEVERMLFGQPESANGSATTALESVSRKSRLHDARNGTLYLQEIAELPARTQARLARVLRDREATITETGEPAAFDVRLMAGVDPAFEAAVGEGRVREDLFKRLAAIRVDLPPLRERREDIPAIANFVLREVCARHGVPPKTLSRPALALVAALPWRGNAEELGTLFESIVTGLQVGRNIALEDVLQHVRLDGGAVVFREGGTLKQARARFERDYIATVLDRHQGRISETARALGIQRTNLYRKMRTLRIKKATSS